MVTGKSQGAEPFHSLPPTTTQPKFVAASPPSKRDLASWWRQFKRNTRKEEPKGACVCSMEAHSRLPALGAGGKPRMRRTRKTFPGPASMLEVEFRLT
ncbi:hypothetical protein BDV28DRAFT_127652 [Aspergillus coremiiformis]|uniref:Uncharacterized protein n=1 Tax=Aspergillus coremiiformis TaxID=138285 RepID=A0A5N6ZFU5_9EURO|nr:hypothetical protein BDV28DRAFT_127652 [Aspergillus coremiiformis]